LLIIGELELYPAGSGTCGKPFCERGVVEGHLLRFLLVDLGARRYCPPRVRAVNKQRKRAGSKRTDKQRCNQNTGYIPQTIRFVHSRPLVFHLLMNVFAVSTCLGKSQNRNISATTLHKQKFNSKRIRLIVNFKAAFLLMESSLSQLNPRKSQKTGEAIRG